MDQPIIPDEDFVDRYMEAYDKMYISHFARSISSTGSGSSTAIHHRAKKLRDKGVNLPEWQYSRYEPDVTNVDGLNEIIAARIVAEARPKKKPPVV